MSNTAKWIQTMKISWVKTTAYRLNFFLQVIGPALIFFFVKYSLWKTIYDSNPSETIRGYTFSAMITYHIWSFVVSMIGQGHTALNMSQDIRLGRISSYLIYPFNFWEFHTASFLSFQILQILISIVTLSIFLMTGILESISMFNFLLGLGASIYVSLFWYVLQYLTGIIGFWLEETWIIRVSLQVITVFLSGAVFPLDLFPDFWRAILDYTPFPYLTYYPIKVFMGAPVPLLKFAMTLGGWFIIVVFLNVIIWRKGIKNYTAAGM